MEAHSSGFDVEGTVSKGVARKSSLNTMFSFSEWLSVIYLVFLCYLPH